MLKRPRQKDGQNKPEQLVTNIDFEYFIAELVTASGKCEVA